MVNFSLFIFPLYNRYSRKKGSFSEKGEPIECEGWRRHSCLIFLILLCTKPNIEVSGWLYQTKTHFTHIVYQPFSRVSPPYFTLCASTFIKLSRCFSRYNTVEGLLQQKAIMFVLLKL